MFLCMSTFLLHIHVAVLQRHNGSNNKTSTLIVSSLSCSTVCTAGVQVTISQGECRMSLQCSWFHVISPPKCTKLSTFSTDDDEKNVIASL